MAQAQALPFEEGQAKRQFLEFFNEVMNTSVMDLSQSYPDLRSLKVDFNELSKFDPELADAVLDKPDVYLRIAEDAASELNAVTPASVPFATHVRICNLPKENVVVLHRLGAEYLGKLVRVDGVVTQIADPSSRIKTPFYYCRNCSREFNGESFSFGCRYGHLFCPGCGRTDGVVQDIHKGHVDIQNILLQELPEAISGRVPNSIKVILEDDLVRTLSEDDVVSITGIYRPKAEFFKKKLIEFTHYFEAINIEKKAQTAETTDSNQDVNQVVSAIRAFLPFNKVHLEGYHQMALAGFLRAYFNDVDVEIQRGSSRPDIVVNGSIGIEVKGPTRAHDLQTIADKSLRYTQKFSKVLVVLFDVRVSDQHYFEWKVGMDAKHPEVIVLKGGKMPRADKLPSKLSLQDSKWIDDSAYSSQERVEANHSMPKVDKLRFLIGLICDLEQTFGCVSIDDICREVETSSIPLDNDTTRRLVEELKRAGDLYEPKAGFVKSSRKR